MRKLGRCIFAPQAKIFRNNFLKNKNWNSEFGENFQKIRTLAQNLDEIVLKDEPLQLDQIDLFFEKKNRWYHYIRFIFLFSYIIFPVDFWGPPESDFWKSEMDYMEIDSLVCSEYYRLQPWMLCFISMTQAKMQELFRIINIVLNKHMESNLYPTQP